MKKDIFILATAFVAAVILTHTTWAGEFEKQLFYNGNQDQSVVGTWVTEINGQVFELVLNDDGTMSFAGNYGTYQQRPGQLLITMMGQTGAYGLRVSGDSLWLTGADLGGTVMFTRQTTGAYDDGDEYYGEEEECEEGQESDLSWSDDIQETDLIGAWTGSVQGQQFEAEFKPGGELVINGMHGTYSLRGGRLTVAVGDDDAGVYDVRISGDSMFITGDDLGGTIEFKRKQSTGSGGLFGIARRPDNQGGGQQDSGSSLQQQIVGNWSTVINGQEYVMVLKADGSMEFAGNNWTYSVSPGQMVVNAGEQTITYTLQLSGDSMQLSGGDIAGVLSFTRQR